jgi:hypothetical protein
LAQQRIEEARFARIGGPQQDDSNAALENLTPVKAGHKLSTAAERCPDSLSRALAVLFVQILFNKIDLSFEERFDVDKLIENLPNPSAESALELIVGNI